MHFSKVLPILFLVSTVTSLAFTKRDVDVEVAEDHKVTKRQEPGTSPHTIDVDIAPEKLSNWARDLVHVFSDTHGLQSRSTESNTVSKKLKREFNKYIGEAWQSIGGDFHIFRFLSPCDDRCYESEADGISAGKSDPYAAGGTPSGNYRAKREESILEILESSITEEKVCALREILAALKSHGDEDIETFEEEDYATIKRRAPALPKGDIENRLPTVITKRLKSRGFFYDSDEATQTILQALFGFDDEERSWKLRRSIDVESPAALEEPKELKSRSLPKVRELAAPPEYTLAGRFKKRDDEEIVRPGLPPPLGPPGGPNSPQNPSPYGWPDIRGKIREYLPSDADVSSQHIIVTIFRLQEDHRHKRSIIDVEHREEKRNFQPSMFAIWAKTTLLKKLVRVITPPPDSILSKARHGTRSVEVSRAGIKSRGYAIPPPWPKYSDGGYKGIRWKGKVCYIKGGKIQCYSRFYRRKLQTSIAVLQRIANSVERRSEDPASRVKRDMSIGLLKWLQGIETHIQEEAIRNGGYSIPGGDPSEVAGGSTPNTPAEVLVSRDTILPTRPNLEKDKLKGDTPATRLTNAIGGAKLDAIRNSGWPKLGKLRPNPDHQLPEPHRTSASRIERPRPRPIPIHSVKRSFMQSVWDKLWKRTLFKRIEQDDLKLSQDEENDNGITKRTSKHKGKSKGKKGRKGKEYTGGGDGGRDYYSEPWPGLDKPIRLKPGFWWWGN